MDSDKTSIDAIQSTYLSSLLPEENFFGDYAESLIIWPKGHYASNIEEMLDNATILLDLKLKDVNPFKDFNYFQYEWRIWIWIW